MLIGGGRRTRLLQHRVGTGSLNALADFNEDGNPDTFVIWGPGHPSRRVLLGDGAGGFGAPNVFDAPGGLSGLITGDFNNDQHVDVAVGDPNGLKVLIGIGNGDGTVGDPPGGVDPSVPITPFSLDKGDFNSDGNLDIVVGATSGSSVAVLLGNGDGSFAAATTYASGANPFNVVVADFDHDSRLDIAVPNTNGTTISILKGNGNGTFAAPTAITVPGTVVDACAAWATSTAMAGLILASRSPTDPSDCCCCSTTRRADSRRRFNC